MSKNDKERIEFSAIIGNPPYQSTTGKEQIKNGSDVPVTNVFHYFQKVADLCGAKYTSLIYPGKRWLTKSGKGMAEFGENQLNDKTLKRIGYYEDASEIFSNVGISDGITIVFKRGDKTTAGFDFIYNKNGNTQTQQYLGSGDFVLDPNSKSILEKAQKFIHDNKLKKVSDFIGSRKLFGIESNFVELNSGKVRPYKKGEKLGPNEVKLFANDKGGKAGKSDWFVLSDKNLLEKKSIPLISKWKVIVSSANSTGLGRSRQLEILDNNSAFGRSRILLRAFDTKKEAENFYKYMKSEIVRFLLGQSTEGLAGTGNKLPDLLDYTDKNTLINFNKDIDIQLIQHLDLTAEECDYIKNNLPLD